MTIQCIGTYKNEEFAGRNFSFRGKLDSSLDCCLQMKYLDIRTKLNQACHDRHASTPGSNAVVAVNPNEDLPDFVAVNIRRDGLYEVYTRIESCSKPVFYNKGEQRVLYHDSNTWVLGRKRKAPESLQCHHISQDVTPEYKYFEEIQELPTSRRFLWPKQE